MLTDHYELTMVDAALKAGTAETKCVFELFTRRLSQGRRYGVIAGIGRAIAAIEKFRFQEKELQWLKERNFLSQQTLDYLADFKFSGNITGYPEGELFFPYSPLLTVEASFAEGVLIETLLLSILNYDSAVATAASRMVNAAKGKQIAEMGSRRTNEQSAVSAARAAYIAGFFATSNLEAGRIYQIPTMGTASHAFTLLHDDELTAFKAQVAAFGAKTTLLVDTYHLSQGVNNAFEAAGSELGAVRIDSGDLKTVVEEVRSQLDSLGALKTKITVTNDLDEYTIAALSDSSVDTFGVGTSVVTGSGSPTMSMVYKLVAREVSSHNGSNKFYEPVAKLSPHKSSRGGKKEAYRIIKNNQASAEVIVQSGKLAELAKDAQPITTELMISGQGVPEHLGKAGLEAARQRHLDSFNQLPVQGKSLIKGEPALEVIFK